jgi:hypothetical protein
MPLCSGGAVASRVGIFRKQTASTDSAREYVEPETDVVARTENWAVEVRQWADLCG